MSSVVQPMLRSALALGLATLLLALSHATTLPAATTDQACRLRAALVSPAVAPASPFCRAR